MVSDLTKTFDISRQTPSGHSLEELRQDYFIQASTEGNGAASVGGLQVNTGGRKDSAAMALKKQQQATSDMLLLAELSRQLEAITNDMIAKYGEDFADNLAAEFLDEETYKKLMEIEAPEERRLAIAKAINEGINNGTIDADAAHNNPDVKGWLETNDKLEQKQIEMGAAMDTEPDADNSSSRPENTVLAKGLDAAFS